MSAQLSMFAEPISLDTGSAISLPVSEPGVTRSAAQDGPMTGPPGPPLALASLFQRLESEKAPLMRGTFGPNLLDSSPSARLTFSLANRLQAKLAARGSILYALTWSLERTPSGHPIPRLRASARRISVNDCTGVPCGWPTSRGEDAESAGVRHSRGVADTMTAVSALAGWPTTQGRDHKSGETGEAPLDHNARPLSEAVVLAAWSTATVNDARSGCNATANRSREAKHQHPGWTLVDLVSLTGWATAQARDHFPAHSSEYVADKVAQGHGMANLNDQASLATHGPERIGYSLGPNGWAMHQASGPLNPNHSRWLMGLPREWCDSAVTAMQSLPRKRKAGLNV